MNHTVTPEDLIAYINDEASAELIAQIEADPELLEQAEAMRAIDRDIRARMPLEGRPTLEDEMAYLLGDLSAEKAALLEQFWSKYPFSRSDYAETMAAPNVIKVDSQPFWKPFQEQAKQTFEVLLAMLKTEFSGEVVPRGLSLSGQGPRPVYVVETHGIEVELNIYPHEANSNKYEIICRIKNTNGVDKLPQNMRLELWNDAQVQPITPAEEDIEDHQYIFEELISGVYTLIIIGDQLEVHVPHIQVEV